MPNEILELSARQLLSSYEFRWTLARIHTAIIKPPTPGVIVTTRPMKPLLYALAYATDSHVHQLLDGRFIIGEKAGPPRTEQHLTYLTEQPNAYAPAKLSRQHAERVLGTARRYLPQLESAEVERVGVGWRPLPVDGLPTIGRPTKKPKVYFASMHSGVTLAPIVGQLAALEILDKVSVDLLADFRIERHL